MTKPISIALLAGLSTLLGGEAHRRTEKGNRLYLEGRHESALNEYQKAQGSLPEAPQLHYDIGNVLYRQENWAGAAEAYEHALGIAGKDLSARAAYNLGNALFHDEKYDEAVKAYTRALKGAPADGDAKHNLELALRAVERERQKQQQQPKQDPKDQKQDQQKPSPSKGDGEQKNDDKSSQDQPKDQDKQQEPKDGGMTKEEAQKLLDRLNDQEKQNLKQERAKAAAGERFPEKDW